MSRGLPSRAVGERPGGGRAPLWVATLLAVGFVAAMALPSLPAGAWSGGESATRIVGSQLCHQLPSRTLAVGGAPMAVCARCFGLYVGGALALIASSVLVAFGHWPRPSRWLLFLVVPSLADAVWHLTLGMGLGNLPRVAVSIPAGFALGLFLAEGFCDLGRRAREGDAARAASSVEPAPALEENP